MGLRRVATIDRPWRGWNMNGLAADVPARRRKVNTIRYIYSIYRHRNCVGGNPLRPRKSAGNHPGNHPEDVPARLDTPGRGETSKALAAGSRR
jgi:hypothetical protein